VIRFLFIAIQVFCFARVSGAEAQVSLNTFEERRRAVLETFAAEGKEKFIRAECLFSLGRTQEALVEVNKGLDALVPGNKINRWMHGGNTGFIAWPGIVCYIRFENQAFINGWALNHYVNQSYAIFSRSSKAGGRPWQGQSYPCGVMWDEPEPDKGSHLWITHPAADEKGKMGIHTHGVSAHEQEILGRDSLLFVFRIPDGVPFPYALGYVPGGHRAFINDAATDGRIFLHYGSVLIAITASQAFDWDPSSGIRAPASPPRKGDSEFRVLARHCAVAIETALPSEFPAASPSDQLKEFRAKVMGSSSLKFVSGETVSGAYQSRSGGSLECTFGGPDRINGRAVDYQTWPSSKSPWTTQISPDGPMEIRDKVSKRIYDFSLWKIHTSPY
jgi:hypothetical protein